MAEEVKWTDEQKQAIYEKEVRDLKRKQENLNRYLGRTQTDPVQEQQTKNKNHSL